MLRFLRSLPLFFSPSPWWERHWMRYNDLNDLFQGLDYFLLWWREHHPEDARADSDILLSEDFEQAIHQLMIRHPWYSLKCLFRQTFWRLRVWFWEVQN
ncbi:MULTISPECIES: hypothetical protein [Trichocoleus]|uniref:Uncharacterized protein n=1 Tax=Trichocoleus desertorum GB2-A4 TaxID=2933944 RepID=A0ABV0JCN1_9CYAN|nr:hypothetical protein [Trichocoleus sp. FACHB-46]MBD1864196.1 hypothetical protein [Trichocoleus sp. FACHB-46]